MPGAEDAVFRLQRRDRSAARLTLIQLPTFRSTSSNFEFEFLAYHNKDSPFPQNTYSYRPHLPYATRVDITFLRACRRV